MVMVMYTQTPPAANTARHSWSDEHEHMMRPGLFSQREGPGSEPGNSLVRPDGHA